MHLALLVLIQGIVMALLPAVVRLLGAFGAGFVTYQGLGLFIDQIEDFVFQSYSGMPATAFSIVTLAGFDKAITILFSAMVAALTVRGMSAVGDIKLLRFNG